MFLFVFIELIKSNGVTVIKWYSERKISYWAAFTGYIPVFYHVFYHQWFKEENCGEDYLWISNLSWCCCCHSFCIGFGFCLPESTRRGKYWSRSRNKDVRSFFSILTINCLDDDSRWLVCHSLSYLETLYLVSTPFELILLFLNTQTAWTKIVTGS